MKRHPVAVRMVLATSLGHLPALARAQVSECYVLSDALRFRILPSFIDRNRKCFLAQHQAIGLGVAENMMHSSFALRAVEWSPANDLSRMAAIVCLLLFVPCTRSDSASRFDQDVSPAAAAEATQHNAAGLARAKNRDLEGAIVEFSEAIRLDPTYADAFRNRGLAKMNKNVVDEAIDDFSRAIVLNARDAAAFFYRGRLFARKREFDRAIADFSAALAINPTVANGYDDRGLAKTESGDVDGGIADLTTAISLDPKSARAYLNRGYAYSKKKDDAAALSNYSQAITLNPDFALAYSNRGEVKTRLNDQVGAIADFTTALRLDSARALPYYFRGLARRKQCQVSRPLLPFSRLA